MNAAITLEDLDAQEREAEACGVRDAMTAAPSIAILDAPKIAEPLPDLDYLVPEIGLVAGAGAPHLIAGYGFSGKTVAAQALLLALASERGVWGVYTGKARRVLHVDLEQGDRLTRRRYQRLARAMGVRLEDLGDALALAVMPPISLTATHVASWRELMTGRDLVLVDSLRAATAGADENDSSIRAGLDMLGALSEQTACRALVVHHARKPNADAPAGRYAIRGSGAIYDACDSAYVFSAEKDEPVAVEHVKARSHGEPVEAFALVISDVEIGGDQRAGLAVRLHGAELVAERREAARAAADAAKAKRDALVVERAIVEHPGLAVRELRAVVRMSGDRLAAALAHLGDRIDVREVVEGRTRRRCHYARGTSC